MIERQTVIETQTERVHALAGVTLAYGCYRCCTSVLPLCLWSIGDCAIEGRYDAKTNYLSGDVKMQHLILCLSVCLGTLR